jgi:hypothetical protein
MPTAAEHANPVFFRNLLLKEQAVQCYRFAGLTEELVPRKGQVARLDVPTQRLLITIQLSEHRSTYGKRLYLCEHSYTVKPVSQRGIE